MHQPPPSNVGLYHTAQLHFVVQWSKNIQLGWLMIQILVKWPNKTTIPTMHGPTSRFTKIVKYYEITTEKSSFVLLKILIDIHIKQ